VTDVQALQQAHRDYAESRILSAHPVEVVHMLYQVAIDNVNAAITHLRNRDHFARSLAVTKAQSAIHELLLALDHSVNAPFTRTLSDLYHYSLQQITQGHGKQSEQAFREALSILTTLATAWAEVKKRLCGEEPGLHPGSSEDPRHETPVEPRLESHLETMNAYSEYSSSLSNSVLSRDWSG
jgi:flagellar protein FliS